jgi:hypothetical protein
MLNNAGSYEEQYANIHITPPSDSPSPSRLDKVSTRSKPSVSLMDANGSIHSPRDSADAGGNG